MKGLDFLLEQGEPEERKDPADIGLNSLLITRYAFEKAYAYAKLAVQKAGRTIECGGYLIAPKSAQDRIATDSFLAKNQDVSDGLFTINAEDVIIAGREIDKMGYKVLGWWHSHGKLRTFFSITDDSGQITVLNEIGAINYIAQKDEKEIGNLEVITEGRKIIMFDRRSPERKYEIEVKDPKDISIERLKFHQEKRIGFAYGLVVNVPGPWDWDSKSWRKKERKNMTNLIDNTDYQKRPYAEIATRDLCGYCKNSMDKSVVVDISILDSGDFKIDEATLMAEIEDRVRIKPKFFSPSSKPEKKKQQTPLFLPFFFGGYGFWGNTEGSLYEENTAEKEPIKEDEEKFRTDELQDNNKKIDEQGKNDKSG